MNYTFKPDEVLVSVFDTASEGGMHLQSTPQGVKVIHLPTRKEFTCEEHRSQYRNREDCFEELEQWLFDNEEQEEKT